MTTARAFDWLGWGMTAAMAILFVATIFASYLVEAQPAPEKKQMAELDALKIGKLYAERQTYEQALLKLQAQQENLRIQTQLTRRELEDTNRALQALIVTAAREAGLSDEDLKQGWQPAPERREWVKGTPPTP